MPGASGSGHQVNPLRTLLYHRCGVRLGECRRTPPAAVPPPPLSGAAVENPPRFHGGLGGYIVFLLCSALDHEILIQNTVHIEEDFSANDFNLNVFAVIHLLASAFSASCFICFSMTNSFESSFLYILRTHDVAGIHGYISINCFSLFREHSN